MWTHEDYTFDNLPNIIVRGALLDGELKYYQLYPSEGYRLHVAFADRVENAYQPNRIDIPYYSNGGAVVYDYDFTTNPLGFEAVLKEA